MIEGPQIVKETRQVSCSISERFGNDPDRYIDYLRSQDDKDKLRMTTSPETIQTDQPNEHDGRC